MLEDYAPNKPWMILPFTAKDISSDAYPSRRLTKSLVNKALEKDNTVILNWYTYPCGFDGAECDNSLLNYVLTVNLKN